MGCKIIPVKYMKEIDGYDASNAAKVKEYQDKAWDELVAMIGVLGVNDTKYKSMKEEPKVDYSKGHCNYPKTIPSLKQQLDGRWWDANPNNNRGNGKSTGLSKEAKAALIEAGAVPQSNFYQKSNKERRCHCCGSKNHLLPKCPRKDDTAPNQWYQVTGVSLFQEVMTAQGGGNASTITATQASQSGGGQSGGRSSQSGGGNDRGSRRSGSRGSESGSSGLSSSFCQLAYSTCLLNGKKLPRAVLLDNQSTVHIFSHEDLMYDVQKVPPGYEEDLATNGGILMMDHIAKTKHFGSTWYDTRAITNVLSYALVRKQVGPNNIGYDAKKDLFWVKVGKHCFEFKKSKEGLYYYLPRVLKKILRAS